MEKRRGKRTDLELRGRMMAIESIQLTMLTHIAEHFERPQQFIAQIMDNVENILTDASQHTEDADQEEAARYALACYRGFSQALLAHINRHAAPAGRA